MKQKTENSRKCDNMLRLKVQPHRPFIVLSLMMSGLLSGSRGITALFARQ